MKENSKIEKVIEELKKIDVEFLEKMKNKSYKMGVMHRIEEELTPIEILRKKGQEQKEKILKDGVRVIPVIDTGDDENAWWEGFMMAGKYFKSLRNKKFKEKNEEKSY